MIQNGELDPIDIVQTAGMIGVSLFNVYEFREREKAQSVLEESPRSVLSKSEELVEVMGKAKFKRDFESTTDGHGRSEGSY